MFKLIWHTSALFRYTHTKMDISFFDLQQRHKKHIESRRVGEISFPHSRICERRPLVQTKQVSLKKAMKLDFAYWQAKVRLLSSAVTTQIQHHNLLTPGAEAGAHCALRLVTRQDQRDAGLSLPCLWAGAGSQAPSTPPAHPAPLQLTRPVHSGAHQQRCKRQNIQRNRDAGIILCIFLMSY